MVLISIFGGERSEEFRSGKVVAAGSDVVQHQRGGLAGAQMDFVRSEIEARQLDSQLGRALGAGARRT